jgi:voltage-gated potassium channel
MAIMAAVTIWLALLPETPVRVLAIELIWGVFLIEYGIRLARAPQKLMFVRRNLPDLIALIPSGLFRGVRALRLVRVLRFFRGTEVLWRASTTVREILRTNQLGHVLAVTGLLVVGGGVLITRVEPDIHTIADGLWWSIVTTTTVGYGDLSPKTGEGRLIAAGLMLIGIGTIGMVTGSIATHFLGRRRTGNPHIVHLQGQLDRWEEMTPHERQQLLHILEALARRAEETHK